MGSRRWASLLDTLFTSVEIGWIVNNSFGAGISSSWRDSRSSLPASSHARPRRRRQDDRHPVVDLGHWVSLAWVVDHGAAVQPGRVRAGGLVPPHRPEPGDGQRFPIDPMDEVRLLGLAIGSTDRCHSLKPFHRGSGSGACRKSPLKAPPC